MADEKRFSHIAVNAGEDDDVVIQAGAYAPAPQTPQEQIDEEIAAKRAQWEVEEPAAQAEAASAAESYVAPEPEPAAPEPQPAAEPADGYEQTLADLESEPMSGMQKAVLAGVAIIIVVAVIYFAFFMH